MMRNPDLFSSSATRLMMMGGLQSGMQADEAELREARRRRQQELGLESLLGSASGLYEDAETDAAAGSWDDAIYKMQEAVGHAEQAVKASGFTY